MSTSVGTSNAGTEPSALGKKLRPTTSPTGFERPGIWSFPPFFTIQPNPTTQQHQLALWTELVLAWAKHDRVFSVNADSPEPGDVFNNKTIGRKLQPPALKQLLAHMAAEGNAAADPPKQTTTYLLYWRKPEEWGQLIYDWVSDNGFLNTIMTFYEIVDGDLAHTTEVVHLHANGGLVMPACLNQLTGLRLGN
ncbi:hypothetical protein A1Q2_02779 [Trichosporon asahii var. asahii CBS 8904]|uniref:ESCRT-II complex component n=1 Tax=Trichosporon asahii var. asahii (strain CBS 8904) TaxID=1220162 RepID=K1W1Y1_TRIAC|nr:hypothetical protein A1Q2_02779 [Trichosporon asahii var. asahii CBS 8904]